MKKLLLILPMVFLLCFTFSCQDKAATAELEEFKAQAALEEENKALVMRYFEAWYSADIEALKEIFSPDYIWHSSGQDLSLEETIESFKQQMAMIPDRTISNEDIIVKGDKVIVRFTFKGTHEGDIEGFPATGLKVESKGIEIVRAENGKVVESWEQMDMLGLMMQLGMELKPKEDK